MSSCWCDLLRASRFRFWLFSASRIEKLIHLRSCSEFLHSVGDKVTFRDRTRHAPSADVLTGPHSNGQYVFTITRTQTNAHVLWQDGTTTVQPATHLEHCVSIDDDVDVFPGDVGVFTGYTPPRVAVVQNFNSKKRTARLRWTKEGGEELVSGLEFDQHGPPPEVYGVRRQDHVLITKEGTTNGAEAPTVPRLGESEVLTGAFPPVEILRTEVSLFASPAASIKPDKSILRTALINRSRPRKNDGRQRSMPITHDPPLRPAFHQLVRRSTRSPPRRSSPCSFPIRRDWNVPSRSVVPR